MSDIYLLSEAARRSIEPEKYIRLKDYVNHTWVPYDILKLDTDRKQEQIRLQLSTGLRDIHNGIEFVFIPTKKMKLYEQLLHDLCNKLKVEDNVVELCNEVFYTAKIEGAKTTLLRTKQLYNGEYIDMSNYKSEKMVVNGFHATKFLNLMQGNLTDDILVKLWNIVVEDVCENENIRGEKYRIGNVQVGKHVPLDFKNVDEAISNWINYYNSSNLNSTPFIKAALLHYAFEYIHPFCDGNGRTGRFLMSNFLIKNCYDSLSAVSFSRGIEKDVTGYYNSLAQSNNVYTDCTPFIEWMLENMVKTLSELIDKENV